MYYLIIANNLPMASMKNEKEAIKYYKDCLKEPFTKVELITFKSTDVYFKFIKERYEING